PPEHPAAADPAARAARGTARPVDVGRTGRDARRDARRRQAPRGRAGPDRRHRVRPGPAGDADGGHAVLDPDRDQPGAQQGHLPDDRRCVMPVASKYVVNNLGEALAQRSFPTITAWNRLEGRPRRDDFSRALKAEVRDAAWMLARQWQIGEF